MVVRVLLFLSLLFHLFVLLFPELFGPRSSYDLILLLY